MANVLVPIGGVLALLGGLSVLLGVRARIGALLLVVFLVPVTLMMHRFWAETDPMMMRMQQAHFMKNIAMLGAALDAHVLRRRSVQLRRTPARGRGDVARRT